MCLKHQCDALTLQCFFFIVLHSQKVRHDDALFIVSGIGCTSAVYVAFSLFSMFSHSDKAISVKLSESWSILTLPNKKLWYSCFFSKFYKPHHPNLNILTYVRYIVNQKCYSPFLIWHPSMLPGFIYLRIYF